MYGAQAIVFLSNSIILFENDVEMYGAQALCSYLRWYHRFENDVEMYGAQASYCQICI